MHDQAVAANTFGSDTLRTKDRPPRIDRMRILFDAHFVFICKQLRRFGVSENDVDDAAQRVFTIVWQRLDDIALTSERAFLYGTARRVASSFRRAARRRCEVYGEPSAVDPDARPSAHEELVRRQEMAILERIIARLPAELCVVLTLCELEELTLPQVAALQEVPIGTATSRLRRARREVAQRAKCIGARHESCPSAEDFSLVARAPCEPPQSRRGRPDGNLLQSCNLCDGELPDLAQDEHSA
jgi:RNA polymerase sigma-70 factor, ECF subfamily